jgi:hypothetical protein
MNARTSHHLRLQEYCDCYLETDFKKELDAIGKWGVSADVTGDPQEVALKFLGLAILYGMKENAGRISLSKGEGGVQFNVEAAGKYRLPAPSEALVDQAFKAMRSITHLEGEPASEPLSLGLRNDRLELGIGFDRAGGREVLTISFPRS